MVTLLMTIDDPNHPGLAFYPG